MKQRPDDVLLDHVAGNAKLGGNLAVGKPMQSAQDEDLLATVGQFGDSLRHQNQRLPCSDGAFLSRRFVRRAQTCRFLRKEFAFPCGAGNRDLATDLAT